MFRDIIKRQRSYIDDHNEYMPNTMLNRYFGIEIFTDRYTYHDSQITWYIKYMKLETSSGDNIVINDILQLSF